MTILALEFSSPQRSVAVLRTDCAVVAAKVVEAGGHGSNVFRMIEQVLAGAKIEREQIDVITIGLGPGSYTGIRAAISIAQGWQLGFAGPEQDNSCQTMASAQRRLARGVKLLGVGSAECLAAQARAEKILGCVSVVIDAQRNEFYLATYEVTPESWRETAPLKILSLAGVQSRATEGGILIGPEVTKWFPGGRIIFPRAAALAELAARRSDFVPGEKLEPVYLRETNFVKSPPRRPAASGSG
jgi:tRNA threonylcarbamoyladenosine biosynthesis protein TsaB